jgi:hypothetical protein
MGFQDEYGLNPAEAEYAKQYRSDQGVPPEKAAEVAQDSILHNDPFDEI